MDQKTKERIFEPFFTRKEVGSGTGLGLSVVHGIINNYGGAITVDSTPGEGTTFTIFLPKYGLSTITSDKMNKKLVRGDEHIMFVDDEPEITYMGKKMLENLGYRVTIKSESPAALEEFLKNPRGYDLVVTDQNMPQMKGTEMVSKMKDVMPDLKIVIITGYADNLSEKEIARYGISEVILKPMVLDDFSKIIRKVLDQKDVKIA
jgi:CheY-like chemotaxis protein